MTDIEAPKSADADEDHLPRLSIQFDPEEYMPLLADEHLSDEQKHELLTALWNIMKEFVWLGFGVHPVQQARIGCGQSQKSPAHAANEAAHALYLEDHFITEHITQTGGKPRSGKETNHEQI